VFHDFILVLDKTILLMTTSVRQVSFIDAHDLSVFLQPNIISRLWPAGKLSCQSLPPYIYHAYQGIPNNTINQPKMAYYSMKRG